jgi:hypothetical protein
MIEWAKNRNADPDLAYKSYADPDPVSKKYVDPDPHPQRCNTQYYFLP